MDIEKEILDILDKSDLALERQHAENTLLWVKKIRPDASMALQIAAIGHDIERGVPPRYRDEDFENHDDYKTAHSERGAQILEEIMRRYKIDEKVIREATDLVRMHETGGSEDADVLMDADSISFFDNNLDFYIGYKGLEGAIKQIEYKFNRCSPRAQKYIEEIERYEKFKKQIKPQSHQRRC